MCLKTNINETEERYKGTARLRKLQVPRIQYLRVVIETT